MNAAGQAAWRESYTPFGEALQNPATNRDEAGFTGHIRDHATGLTYAQARYYNPVTARFLSPDPVGFASGGPGYFNRYAYTMNDPVNYTDPTGEAATAATGGRLMAAGAAASIDGPFPFGDAVAVGILVWTAYDIFISKQNNDPTTTPGGREIAHGAGSGAYLPGKGWTGEEVDELLNNPAQSYDNKRPNNTSGQRQRTYVDTDGNWVVVDEQGRVTQVNERGNPHQKPPERDEPEQEPEPEPEPGPERR